MLYDVFICHASEDKESFVRPLAESLQAEHVEVWFDEFSLKLGDSIRRSIDRGLRQSRFGVVVLSPAFFEKNWPQYELDGLINREMRGRDIIILPVWHGVTHGDVTHYSPPLAGRKAVSSGREIQRVVDEIVSVVRPQGSPLIIARDMLIEWGLTPPVITDEFWLDVVEASNVTEERASRWSFPLPSKEGGSMQRGERLAWTAMQMNWVNAAEEIPITPLTPPERVLDFIRGHPGLFEICFNYPDLLIEYAPQLAIPGLGEDFEEIIEQRYMKSCAEAEQRRLQSPTFGSGTTRNKESPLCDEEWALRHPTFGNYEPAYVTNAYFSGGLFGPSVSPYEHTDHALWLLSAASSWLPEKAHSVLLEGMTHWHVWPWGDIGIDKGGNWKSNGALIHALYEALDGNVFKWSKVIKDDLRHRIELAIQTLRLPDAPNQIMDLFMAHDFVGRWIKAEQRRRKHSGRQSARRLKPRRPRKL